MLSSFGNWRLLRAQERQLDLAPQQARKDAKAGGKLQDSETLVICLSAKNASVSKQDAVKVDLSPKVSTLSIKCPKHNCFLPDESRSDQL